MTWLWLFDRVTRAERPHPNIATHQARPYTPAWREFSRQWPYSEPVGFYEHCWNHGVAVAAHTLDTLGDRPAIYPIALSFFDHEIPHLSMIPHVVRQRVAAGQVRVAIFYSEGDDPSRIRSTLTRQEHAAGLPIGSTHLVSANSAAEHVANAQYFADDELLFRWRNRWHAPSAFQPGTRPWRFTCLSRTHKWWRLATVAELERRGWLRQACWSYNTQLDCGDSWQDCAVSVDDWPGLREHMTVMYDHGPYRADQLDSDQHNDHEHMVAEHFTNSYFQVILETHFDADGSGGTFITEKTFKAIKHGQPFVIFGPAGTLAQLRRMGYDTFDHAIDNSYDDIQDNNQRWARVFSAMEPLVQDPDPVAWLRRCQDSAEHNQQRFQADARPGLNRVLERLYPHADHQ